MQGSRTMRRDRWERSRAKTPRPAAERTGFASPHPTVSSFSLDSAVLRANSTEPAMRKGTKQATNNTSALCTLHSARCTPHATRRTPHVTRHERILRDSRALGPRSLLRTRVDGRREPATAYLLSILTIPIYRVISTNSVASIS